MPFTPSHVAAVLPFVRTPLFPAALVIGSMTPDLFYYVPIRVPRDLAHSAMGLVTVDLAFGVIVFVLWRLVFRQPVVDFTPRWLRARLHAVHWPGLKPAGMPWWRAAVILVVSLLIGSATHLVWDSFTHEGWLVSQLTWLQHPIGPLPAFKWGQHLSTVLGAVLLVAWIIAWVRRTRPVEAQSRVGTPLRLASWFCVGATGLAVALVIWIGGLASGEAPFDPSLVFVTTVAVGAAGMVGVLFALAWWLLSAEAQSGNAGDSQPGPA